MGEWKKEELKEKFKIMCKKENLLVIGLIGAILLVISIPVSSEKKTVIQKQNAQTDETEQSRQIAQKDLERRVEDVLSQVDGVGKVKVMITYKGSAEKVVMQDVETDLSAQEDTKDGEKQKDSTKNRKETTVYVKAQNEESPYVVKELEPEIEGVVVAAQGGDNSQIQKNISDAIMALFDIEVHKIKVMKLSDSENQKHS